MSLFNSDNSNNLLSKNIKNYVLNSITEITKISQEHFVDNSYCIDTYKEKIKNTIQHLLNNINIVQSHQYFSLISGISEINFSNSLNNQIKEINDEHSNERSNFTIDDFLNNNNNDHSEHHYHHNENGCNGNSCCENDLNDYDIDCNEHEFNFNENFNNDNTDNDNNNSDNIYDLNHVSQNNVFFNNDIDNVNNNSDNDSDNNSDNDSDNNSDNDSDNESDNGSDNDSNNNSNNDSDHESDNGSDKESDNESDHESDNGANNGPDNSPENNSNNNQEDNSNNNSNNYKNIQGLLSDNECSNGDITDSFINNNYSQCCARIGNDIFNVSKEESEFLDNYPPDTYVDEQGLVYGKPCQEMILDSEFDDGTIFCEKHSHLNTDLFDIRKKTFSKKSFENKNASNKKNKQQKEKKNEKENKRKNNNETQNNNNSNSKNISLAIKNDIENKKHNMEKRVINNTVYLYNKETQKYHDPKNFSCLSI